MWCVVGVGVGVRVCVCVWCVVGVGVGVGVGMHVVCGGCGSEAEALLYFHYESVVRGMKPPERGVSSGHRQTCLWNVVKNIKWIKDTLVHSTCNLIIPLINYLLCIVWIMTLMTCSIVHCRTPSNYLQLLI